MKTNWAIKTPPSERTGKCHGLIGNRQWTEKDTLDLIEAVVVVEAERNTGPKVKRKGGSKWDQVAVLLKDVWFNNSDRFYDKCRGKFSELRRNYKRYVDGKVPPKCFTEAIRERMVDYNRATPYVPKLKRPKQNLITEAGEGTDARDEEGECTIRRVTFDGEGPSRPQLAVLGSPEEASRLSREIVRRRKTPLDDDSQEKDARKRKTVNLTAAVENSDHISAGDDAPETPNRIQMGMSPPRNFRPHVPIQRLDDSFRDVEFLQHVDAIEADNDHHGFSAYPGDDAFRQFPEIPPPLKKSPSNAAPDGRGRARKARTSSPDKSSSRSRKDLADSSDSDSGTRGRAKKARKLLQDTNVQLLRKNIDFSVEFHLNKHLTKHLDRFAERLVVPQSQQVPDRVVPEVEPLPAREDAERQERADSSENQDLVMLKRNVVALEEKVASLVSKMELITEKVTGMVRAQTEVRKFKDFLPW